jgi:tRNA(Glu) U13 pseudouridine synthase TruD
MNLPDSIERMKTEEKKSSELIKLEEESNEKLKHLSNEISHEELDVEYDEMYDDDYLYSSNEIESMSQVLEESKVDENALELERRRNSVREYSIDTWNGSPGLPQWGYDNRDDKT